MEVGRNKRSPTGKFQHELKYVDTTYDLGHSVRRSVLRRSGHIRSKTWSSQKGKEEIPAGCSQVCAKQGASGGQTTKRQIFHTGKIKTLLSAAVWYPGAYILYNGPKMDNYSKTRKHFRNHRAEMTLSIMHTLQHGERSKIASMDLPHLQAVEGHVGTHPFSWNRNTVPLKEQVPWTFCLENTVSCFFMLPWGIMKNHFITGNVHRNY